MEGDVSYIESLLNGEQPQAAARSGGARGRGRQRGSGQRGGRGGRGDAGGRAPRREEGSRSQAAGPSSAAPVPPGEDPAASPGPQSTARALHCAACDCWVPRRPGSWETHVTGIRHTRQALSLRVHGEPGHLVLSAFESLPGPSESTHRLVGRSAAGFNLPQAAAQGGATGSGRAAAAVAAAAEEPGMRELRLALQAELLAMFGSTPQYHAACAEVGPGPLAAALAVLRQRDRDAVRDRDRAWELEENDPATVRIDDRIQITLVNGAEAVALAHLIASGEISGPRLHIIGGVQDEWDAQLMPVRTQMCLLLGLKLVFGALQRTATASAYLLITCPLLDDYGPPGVVGVGGGDGLSPLHKRAWERVLQSVQVLLETTPSLRVLTMNIPVKASRQFEETYTSRTEGLRAAPRDAALRLRANLLLALHPRLGCCSMLSLLPREVFGLLFEQVAPLPPCQVYVTVDYKDFADMMAR